MTGPAMKRAKEVIAFIGMKPGDRVADIVAGRFVRVTDTLHRIDVARVKTDVLAAGFKLDGDSKAVANPADDPTKMVFDPAIRGTTDQFLLRFKQPN